MYYIVPAMTRLHKMPCPPVAALSCFMMSSMDPEGRAFRSVGPAGPVIGSATAAPSTAQPTVSLKKKRGSSQGGLSQERFPYKKKMKK